MNKEIEQLDRETLLGMLQDFAKNWLAHDGLWFQAVEKGRDMDEAIKYDTEAWERFTVIEAKRIMALHGIARNPRAFLRPSRPEFGAMPWRAIMRLASMMVNRSQASVSYLMASSMSRPFSTA